MQLRETIRSEGQTRFYIPALSQRLSSKMAVFYNPAMEFNRDVAVLFFEVFAKDKHGLKIIDGLAASGVLGVRLANEVSGDFVVMINDHNPVAYRFIKNNIQLNKLSNAVATKRDLNALLSENHYDFIELDPFGTPTPFIDSALRSIKRFGVLALTSTNTSPLCGTYPSACRRKYMAVPLRTAYRKELGLRILIGYCVREAAKYDLAPVPLLTYSAAHCFRLYLQIEKGARRAEQSLSKLGFAIHNFKTGERRLVQCAHDIITGALKEGEKFAGPLWCGELFNIDWVRRLEPRHSLHTKKKIAAFLKLWLEEANAPALFYDTAELGNLLKLSPPSLSDVLEELRFSGHIVTRTHFSPTGFKTDADIATIKSVITKLAS